MVANPLVGASYLQMVKAVASSIGRWRVFDAWTGSVGSVSPSTS
jgi:hypothetical protein